MFPKALKVKLTPNCAVRIRVEGRISPEFIDGTFVKIDQAGVEFQEPGGWREILWAHHSQITEIDRKPVK
jgi:hypothetical protein